jgi:hypothetical protein
MANNDSDTGWTPGMTIPFGGLDFIINGEGTMDRALEASVLKGKCALGQFLLCFGD